MILSPLGKIYIIILLAVEICHHRAVKHVEYVLATILVILKLSIINANSKVKQRRKNAAKDGKHVCLSLENR
jgi:hypothetical protein